jgi:hypothetical protein
LQLPALKSAGSKLLCGLLACALSVGAALAAPRQTNRC